MNPHGESAHDHDHGHGAGRHHTDVDREVTGARLETGGERRPPFPRGAAARLREPIGPGQEVRRVLAGRLGLGGRVTVRRAGLPGAPAGLAGVRSAG
ncbi:MULTISPECIES: hypothetical protein [Streptomyces]|uniref:hypothetical protein n=1 Tax=Streptomyces TaxID=1883 RepID=UPI000F3A8DE7|nr:hypothetical protein [Streptomyces sp. ADI95-16]AYV31652.1 hypothetical protein EES41_33445 [Streptomyces sp. ADI95-16]